MLSYVVIAVLGAGVFTLYWLGISKAFSARSHTQGPAQQTKEQRATPTPGPTSSGTARPEQPEPETPKALKATHEPQPTTLPEVTLDAHIQPGPYPEGFEFAGIVWQKEYSDVRLDISVKKAPIHDLDFVIAMDTTIMGMGQITQFPGVTAFPVEGNISAVALMGKDDKGNDVSIPIAPTSGNVNAAPTYRVHCTEVFANTILRLAIASRALNLPNPDGSLPTQLFAPHRDPRGIRLEGTYKAGTISHPIKVATAF